MSNDNINVIEQAVRVGLVFNSIKGSLNVIDLFNLPLESKRGSSLDSLWAECKNVIDSTSSSVSFVNKNKTVDITAQLRVDVLEHIITVRQTDNAAAADVRSKSAERGRLLELLANNKIKADANLTDDEIKARIASLG